MSGWVMAADDVTARALKLYERHHYEEAIRLLSPELAGMDSSKLAGAHLALGMIHLSNAKLYRELYQTALVIELDYLGQLGKQKTGASSRMVDLYLGLALIEAGKQAEAIQYLRRFVDQAGAQLLLKSFAEIELGVAYSRQKQAESAAQVWLMADVNKPEIKAALAGAYAAAGALEHKPVAMADAAMKDARTQQYIPGVRMQRNLLRAYSQGGAIEKALVLLNANDFKDASYVEDLGASKSISFYDVSLLDDMARTHLGAAALHLEQAVRDAKVSNTASYFLADAYLQQGKSEASLSTGAGFLSQTQAPEQYRDFARAHQGAALYKAGRRTDAIATWQALADKPSVDPAVLAEVILACANARADCTKLEKIALAILEKGEGKKYFPLYAALGKYYLLQKEYQKAVMYMEAGRDKANKNKIEANDPLMLIGLAEAYYRNKNFSENLEIYFEIGKQYPAVRQIQEAMQGIYSVEQQSAGDVKIY